MSIRKKIIACFLVLMLGFSQTWGQEDSGASVKWYKSFFEQKKSQSIDPLLAATKKQVQQAKDAHDPAAEIKSLQELGLLHITQTHDYEQAMNFLIEALAVGDSSHLPKQQIFTYLAIAKVFNEVGNYFKSADFLEQALSLNKNNDDPTIDVLILNELGKMNSQMGRIDQASNYYEEVLSYKGKVDQPTLEVETLFNLAQLFEQQRDYTKSLAYFKRTLLIYRSLKDRKEEAHTLNSIAEVYGGMKNKAREMANFTTAFNIRQAIADKNGIAISGNNIGALYYQEKNYKKAISNLIIALHAAQESENQELLRRNYELLSQCYAAGGQYKEALAYKDLYIAMNDFIDHEKNQQHLLETQNQYSLGKKQLQIEKLEIDNARKEKEYSDQKKIQNGLLALIGLTSIIVGMFVYLYLNKRKSNALLTAAHTRVNYQNARLKELNATKDKFFSIIGHDLKGPLNSLSSFSNLLSNHLESLTQDEIKMLSKDLDKQLKNLFTLLENLLEWSRSQTGAIIFTPEVFNLSEIIEENKDLLNGQAQAKKITLLGPDPSNILVTAHKPSIQTVVRNLISNAIKFTPEGGLIKFEIKLADGFAAVAIADTGVGMTQDIIQKLFRIDTKHSTKGTANEKGTGLGLILCKDFVEKNHGTIKVESEPGMGSVFTFTLPLQKI